ncbi:MAG: hypothetical protein QOJ12_2896 [Thermoleophilales bacterium]|jgi:hypothetical protein|nr:hypothetical protein [Thermoleophilales bacterium]
MEAPGRDVTADPLGPEPTGAPGADGGDGHADDGGVTDKVKQAAEKAKDAVTPDEDDDR